MATSEPKFEVDLLQSLITSTSGNMDIRMEKQTIYNQITDNRLSENKDLSKDHPYSMYQKKGGEYRYRVPGKACAPAIKDFCKKYLGGIYDKLLPYYKEPPPINGFFECRNFTKKPNNELIFPFDRVTAGYNRIKTILINNRIPVLVGLIRGNGEKIAVVNNKYVPYHYVGIVGFGERKFLYIDPLPGKNSTAKYRNEIQNMMGYITLKTPIGRPSQLILIAEDLGDVVFSGPR